MATGAIHDLVVCVPDVAAVSGVAPCPSGSSPQVIQAYLIDPQAQGMFADVDWGVGFQYLMVGFALVMFFYCLSAGVGAIARLVRDYG